MRRGDQRDRRASYERAALSNASKNIEIVVRRKFGVCFCVVYLLAGFTILIADASAGFAAPLVFSRCFHCADCFVLRCE